jgi:hypothetical protein
MGRGSATEDDRTALAAFFTGFVRSAIPCADSAGVAPS